MTSAEWLAKLVDPLAEAGEIGPLRAEYERAEDEKARRAEDEEVTSG